MSTKYWYAYNGYGYPCDAINYIRTNHNPTNFCFGGTAVCAIYSLPSTYLNRPITLSVNLCDYITLATSIGIYYPVFPQKPYVYTRSLI